MVAFVRTLVRMSKLMPSTCTAVAECLAALRTSEGPFSRVNALVCVTMWFSVELLVTMTAWELGVVVHASMGGECAGLSECLAAFIARVRC